MTSLRLASLALLALAATASNAPRAHAWGCVAQGSGTAYGYSYNYSGQRAAMYRAVNECRRRSRTPCRVTSCNPRG